MGARGSGLSRAIRFFREADVEEAAFVLQRGGQILAERTPVDARTPAPKRRRKRKANSKASHIAGEMQQQQEQAN